MKKTVTNNYQISQFSSKQIKSKKFPIVHLINILGFCIVGISAFFIGRMTIKNQKLNSQVVPTIKKQTGSSNVSKDNQVQVMDVNANVSPINSSCDKDGCLFENKNNDAVIGFATLEGYYQPYDKKDWGDVDVKCDAIIVTKGNTALIDSFRKWVNQGNTINMINGKGELILNIDLRSISENYRKQIKSSTESNPIKLDVVRILPQGRGAPGCASFVDIIAVR